MCPIISCRLRLSIGVIRCVLGDGSFWHFCHMCPFQIWAAAAQKLPIILKKELKEGCNYSQEFFFLSHCFFYAPNSTPVYSMYIVSFELVQWCFSVCFNVFHYFLKNESIQFCYFCATLFKMNHHGITWHAITQHNNNNFMFQTEIKHCCKSQIVCSLGKTSFTQKNY